MPLDFTQFSSQLDTLVAGVADENRYELLQSAREQFHRIDQTRLHERLAAHRRRRVPWLTAQPYGDLHTYHNPDTMPADYCIAAADGSNIPPDRHTPVRFYVLNAAWVRMTYGSRPQFTSDVETRLCHRTDELYLDNDRTLPVEGARLSACMAIAELEALKQAIVADDVERPVGLLDGTMILWMIQGEIKRPEVRELLEQYIRALDWFEEKRIPIASYISSPGSFELSNMLRAYLEPERAGNGDSNASEEVDQLCDALRDIRDSLLLREALDAGERTCLFRSQSEILNEYGEHEILYFYMNTGDEVMGEIARVEVPQWVTHDDELIGRLHAALWDQCCRSGEQPPYPPALHEAHEQAVISTGDRQVVEQLLMERLAESDVALMYSAKALHKRTRGV